MKPQSNRGQRRNTGLWIALLGSIIVNGVLGSLYPRHYATPPLRTALVRQQEGPRLTEVELRPSPPPAANALLLAWPTLQTADDVKRLVTKLREAGVEPSVVQSLAIALVYDRFAPRMAEILYAPDKPFWMQGVVTRAQVAPLDREREAMLTDVLGEPVDLTSPLERAIQEQLYGNLPPAKMRLILEIDSRFRGVREKIGRSDPDREAKLAQVADDMKRAIAEVLTPAEFSEYERRQAGLTGRGSGP